MAEKVFSLADLLIVKMGDPYNGSLEKFLNDWSKVCDALSPQPEESVKEYLFYEAVRRHTVLKTSIEHYERIEDEVPKHKDRCFDYLIQTVRRKVEKTDKIRSVKLVPSK